MASINASTSGAGGVITTADNTGTLQLQSGGTNIATISSTGLALNTGNITLPSGAAPAFSAYNSNNYSLSNGVFTKVPFNTEEWDTNSNYDNATNYRFTPTVAGYYQVNGRLTAGSMSGGQSIMAIYKNGSEHRRFGQTPNTASVSQCPIGSAVIYFNGSTDYIEAYAYQSTGSTQTFTGGYPAESYFQASLIRSA